MQAIILAAGVSRRLYPITEHNPKCMLEIGGKAIIDYQLEALLAQKLTAVTVVVGYFREKLTAYLTRRYPQVKFNFIINHHFFETNTAYSVHLCSQVLKSGAVLLMNGDVLYPRELLNRVMASPEANLLAVEAKECGREEVKVIEGGGRRIVAIGKELIPENSLGEFIGIAKFSAEFTGRFADSLEQLIEAGGRADYFEAALDPLLKDSRLLYEDVSDLPCIEIDFIEDVQRARQLVKSPSFA